MCVRACARPHVQQLEGVVCGIAHMLQHSCGGQRMTIAKIPSKERHKHPSPLFPRSPGYHSTIVYSQKPVSSVGFLTEHGGGVIYKGVGAFPSKWCSIKVFTQQDPGERRTFPEPHG